MSKQTPRSRRVGDQMQRELATLIRDAVKDPRVRGSVTVSGVEVTRDMGHARVFMTVLGADAAESQEAADALNNAAGFLRRELSRRMVIRSVPQLHFMHDPSFDRGAHLSELIDRVMENERPRDDD